MLGAYTCRDRLAPQLKKFVEDGGTILAVGRSSMNLAQHLRSAGRATTSSSEAPTAERPLPVEKFYVPGSILRVAVDNTVADRARVRRSRRRVLRQQPGVPPRAATRRSKGVRPVAWFDTPTPLRSGWAWGQDYLEGRRRGRRGDGRARATLFLFGPEITFRAQPHGTFKFLFNGLYLGAASGAAAGSTNTQASR